MLPADTLTRKPRPRVFPCRQAETENLIVHDRARDRLEHQRISQDTQKGLSRYYWSALGNQNGNLGSSISDGKRPIRLHLGDGWPEIAGTEKIAHAQTSHRFQFPTRTFSERELAGFGRAGPGRSYIRASWVPD